MPRRLRIHLADGFYHVTLRGNHQQPIFQTEHDRHLLNAIVAQSIERYAARVHAYCWMTNHLHLLVQISVAPLGQVMRLIASNYAKAFQRRLDTSGHLFERRYFARLVSADAYFMTLLRYIHLNPVASGVVETAAEYPWSSHRAYCGDRAESWLTTDFALAMFGSNRRTAHAAYRHFIADGDPAWHPDDGDSPLETLLRQPLRPEASSETSRSSAGSRTLDRLLQEACERFGISLADLQSEDRAPRMVEARGWICREATHGGVATLSEVARILRRDRATLRHAMRRLGLAEEQPQLPLESAG